MTLFELYQQYISLKTKGSTTYEKAQRGFALEQLLSELFRLEKIQVHESFKSTVDQIDGAIQHNNCIYLVEMRWRAKKQSADDLATFLRKVDRRFEGTRGLLISISGFDNHAITDLKTGRKVNIILWTGEFIEAILSGRLTTTELLDLSFRHASTHGEFLLSQKALDTYCKNRKKEQQLEPLYKTNFAALIQHHIKTFGGRNKEYAQVTAFLQQESQGYLLIEGLSGYGKTSFLANLIHTNSHFIYHFFSQSYNTRGLFTSLSETEFLRNVLEQFPGDDRTAVHQLREEELRPRFIQLLTTSREDKLFLVLDAIDEIEAPINFLKGLLPPELPSGVYVILSSRTAAIGETIESDYFLTKAGLLRQAIHTNISLRGLTADNIRLVIDSINDKHPERDIQVTANDLEHIVRVTEGDPFYVRFLLEDLQEGRLHTSALSVMPKGVEHYLDNQFKLFSSSMKGENYNIHRELIIANIIDSRHPIPISTLTNLVNAYLDKKGNDTPRMSGVNRYEIIAPIRRFLLYLDDSYTFCHKRFREYFLHKMA